MELETGSIDVDQGLLYYERSGSGIPVIFIHGAFADMHMFDPQWEYFQDRYQVIRFDLHGHGKSVPSGLTKYRMDTFIDDLFVLMDVLEIPEAIICGQSWGGSISQGFASRYPERVKGLVLAGSMVSMSVSFVEKLQRYVLVPKWLMLFIIRSLSVEKFVNFSFWLSDIFIGKEFLSNDEQTTNYLKKCMLSIDSDEYLKIWEAIYDFDIFPLERITCPTLVLNGEYEPGKILRHTKELLKRIPDVRHRIIPEAKHGMNMENPRSFNQIIDEFIQGCNQSPVILDLP
jgi:pimeloyl-ACP methyl ester carboxylesterase